jgi:hypothetical protein
MRAVQLALSLVLAMLCAAARAEVSEVLIRDATLAWHWHPDSLRELRLMMPKQTRYRLSPEPDLRLRLRDGQSIAMRGDQFDLTQAWSFTLRGRSHRVNPVHLVLTRGDAFEFALRDGDGQDWLRLDHALPQRRDGGTAAEWRHFDVRVGPALARQLGDASLAGVPLGSATLQVELAAVAKAIESCVAPNFPNTGNFQVDVALTAIDSADAVCNLQCNGAGAAAARVKLTPSAKLQGVGNADVPWYRMFTTSPHGYPYAGNDQHPFLVWAVYRIDADGRLSQLARSGVKHAFFSSNEFPNGSGGCGCGPANVLWSGCTDTYGWSTNDSSAWLSARSEIIPARGQWGRCGSLRDADCNGSDDSPFIPGFDLRAVVAESDLAPALHPGAQWFVEAWYVVRDDANVDNSFGHRRIVPRWVGPTSKWMLDFSETLGGPQLPFVPGPVIDAWVAPGTTTAKAMSRDVVHADGRLRLAARVQDLGGGRWRYDYALLNIDHTRAETQGSEPNLRVFASDGPVAIAWPLSPFAHVAVAMQDGDLDAGNDWTVERDATQFRFVAPTGTSMPWGALFRFSLVANLPPTSGQAAIQPGGSGAPSALGIATLLPDAASILFADGME